MSAKSVSCKTVYFLAALIVALLAVAIAPGQAHAAGVSYVERSWNGSQVVSVTKECTSYTVIDEDADDSDLSGWYVVDRNVTIDSGYCRLKVNGTANIILCDGVKLTLDDGIEVTTGNTLNIYAQAGGTGELYCHSDNNDYAAIGSNDHGGDCGTVNIHGGKVTANTDTQGTDAAGIGGGQAGNGGYVTIYGGTVLAYGGDQNSADGGAGIGGGDRDGGAGGNGGTTIIYGGNVEAYGGWDGAGIGGGDDGDGGYVEIWGGTVKAVGDDGAGIGGGQNGNAGTIKIYGGEVTATGGTDAAGIGGGEGGHGGDITISGAETKVYANAGSNSAGIGGGLKGSGGTVTISGGKEIIARGNDGGAGIGGGEEGAGDTVNISGGVVEAYGSGDAAGIGGGETRRGGTVNISGGEVHAQGGENGAGIGGGNYSGSLSYEGHAGEQGIEQSVSANVTISGGEVHARGGKNGAGIGGGWRDHGANLIIENGTVLAYGGEYAAGIGAGGDDGTATHGGIVQIKGGKVEATAGLRGAGIGGGQQGNGPLVVRISGGEIRAEGKERGAGIGGGEGGYGAGVVISGGTVEAIGGTDAAGIGGGDGSHGGNVEISGDDTVVRAWGGDYGAGIGGGDGDAHTHDNDNGGGGSVTITGGHVEAYGGEDAAGIGGGEGGNGATVKISGGYVNAWGKSSENGSQGGAGIGSGDYDIDTSQAVPSAGNVEITGGEVHAYGGNGAAGIGGGNGVNGSYVKISGGDVSAQGGDYGAGIGGGDGYNNDIMDYFASDRGDAGEIIITGDAKVTATGGERAAGIGCGRFGETGTITIENGTVNAQGGPVGAGIGNGLNNAEADDGQLTIIIKDGTVTATGGRTAAGIGGGSGGLSGTINITGGTVNAQGGVNGGAGIGCGPNLDNESGTVLINIEDGTVTARAGTMYGEDDGETYYLPGAAIGASGGDDGAYFSGIVNLAGGEITAYAPNIGPSYGAQGNPFATIGVSSRDNLRGGEVRFGGAHVTMYNQPSIVDGEGNVIETTDTIVPSVVAYPLTLVEECGDTHFHQRVRYKEDGSQENWDTALVDEATDLDERIIVLEKGDARRDFPVTEVLPCEHEDAVITDNGDGTHKVDCNTCTHVGDETHTYGDPVWTWADDYSWAKAKFTCTKCNHEEELTDNQIDAVTGDKQTDEQGQIYRETTYTATVTFNEQDYTDTKKVKNLLEAAVATTPPEPKELTYNKQDQELVTAGTATGGTMQYAIGEDDTTAPTEGWSEELPKGMDAGPYYVWYKAEGDADHNDSVPACVEASIAKAEVTAPEIASKVYNKQNQKADVEGNDRYTVTKNDGGTDVGEYDVELTLTDPDNYKWPDSDEATITLKFKITPAKATSPETPTTDPVTYDPDKTLADVELPADWTWTDDSTVPTVGNSGYQASIAVDDKNYDYSDVDGYDPETHTVIRTVSLTVNKAEANAPTIASKVYNKQNQKADVPENDAYVVLMNDGGTDVGEYNVVLYLSDTDNYKWADTKIPVKVLKFNITPAMPTALETPTPGPVTYDPAKTLADVALPDGWAWANDAIVPTVGNSGYAASIPVDDKNYDYSGVDGYDPATHKVTRTVPLTVNKAEVTAPTIAPKVYNGKNQKADVADTTAYTVTKNDGGTDAGEYDVELTLKDAANYKWTDSEDASTESTPKTLKFNITQATPNTVTVSIESWTSGDDPNAPTATADFGSDTVAYTYAVRDSEDYDSSVPTEPGAYTVRASVPETASYAAGDATRNFTINPKVSFDANGGAGSKEPVVITYGATYTLPAASIFAKPEGTCCFVEWEVHMGTAAPVSMEPGDTITVTADTTVKAVWDNHDWGAPTYVWADDNSSVTATRECKNDTKHVESETVSTTFEVTKEATETEDGEQTYTATFTNPAFETQTKVEIIPAIGHVHSWGEPTYAWSADNKTAVATRACTINPAHVETETVSTTSEVTKEPTETEDGERTYTATFTNPAFETQTKAESIPATGHVHDWGEPTYTWAEGNGSVIATRTCKSDASHVETETVETTSKVTKPATCEAKGQTTYTSKEFANPAFAQQTKTVEDIPVLKHAWGAPTYTWSSDNKTVTATRVCKNDAEHVESETVSVVSEVTKEPTETEEGERTYTATFNNPAFKPQTKVEAIPAMGHVHDWGAPTYTWSDDNRTVVAMRVCKNDDSHVETETVETTSEIAKPATCTDKGQTTYTSKAFANPAFAQQTKTVEDIDATGHAWSEPTYTWADDSGSVTATRVCTHDETHVESETANTTSEVTKEATETEEGERTYTATFTNPAFETQTKAETIPAKDHVHDWGEPTYTWAADNSSVTATRTCKTDSAHVESETVNTASEVTKEPTETEEGERTYTATFTNPAFAPQSKTESVPANDHVHDWGEPTYAWAADNSSVTATRVCKHDETHVESETANTTSEVTKEATETEEGERTYTATFTNPAFEDQMKTESIPKIDPGDDKSGTDLPDPLYDCTEGEGTAWTKGSKEGATFVFKRKVDDASTFGHFTGIEVDGKPVDPSNYSAESGSAIVTLKPDYLETLDIGEHTLTAFFDDGNDPSVNLTVRAAATDGGSGSGDVDPKPGNVDPKPDTVKPISTPGTVRASTASGTTTTRATSSTQATSSSPAKASAAAKTGDTLGRSAATLILLAAVSLLALGVSLRRRTE